MAASLKVMKSSRSWKVKDSNDSEDLEKLFGSGNVSYTKPVSCNKYWTLYLFLIGVLALFLFGIVVGFYLRADPKVFEECARSNKREDGFDAEKLQAVHNNIMYYMSGDRIGKYNRYLTSFSQVLIIFLTIYFSDKLWYINLCSLVSLFTDTSYFWRLFSRLRFKNNFLRIVEEEVIFLNKPFLVFYQIQNRQC